MRIVLSRRARDEIRAALAVSGRMYGKAKRKQYRMLIEEALALAAEHPDFGTLRPDIHGDARLLPIAQRGRRARHLLLYRVRAGVLEVAAFVDGAQDVGNLDLSWPS